MCCYFDVVFMHLTNDCDIRMQYFWRNNKKFSEIFLHMFQHALMVSNNFFYSARCTTIMYASLHKVVRILIWTFMVFWIPSGLVDSQNARSSGFLKLSAFYASLYVCKILLYTVFFIFIAIFTSFISFIEMKCWLLV